MAWVVDDWDIREVQHKTLGLDMLRRTLLVFEREQTYPIAVMTITCDAKLLEAIAPGCKAYVDMMLVNDIYRRQGVAKKLWQLVAARYGPLTGSGTTDAGAAFMDSLESRSLSPLVP